MMVGGRRVNTWQTLTVNQDFIPPLYMLNNKLANVAYYISSIECRSLWCIYTYIKKIAVKILKESEKKNNELTEG